MTDVLVESLTIHGEGDDARVEAVIIDYANRRWRIPALGKSDLAEVRSAVTAKRESGWINLRLGPATQTILPPPPFPVHCNFNLDLYDGVERVAA